MLNSKIPRHKLSKENQSADRLSDLQPGEKGRILEIGGSEQFRLRLIEMGLTNNAEVCVDKFAPLRDPVELIVRGYHISIRGIDAQKIAIERLS